MFLLTPLGLPVLYFFVYGVIAFIKDRKIKKEEDKRLREEQHRILELLKQRKNDNSIKEE